MHRHRTNCYSSIKLFRQAHWQASTRPPQASPPIATELIASDRIVVMLLQHCIASYRQYGACCRHCITSHRRARLGASYGIASLQRRVSIASDCIGEWGQSLNNWSIVTALFASSPPQHLARLAHAHTALGLAEAQPPGTKPSPAHSG